MSDKTQIDQIIREAEERYRVTIEDVRDAKGFLDRASPYHKARAEIARHAVAAGMSRQDLSDMLNVGYPYVIGLLQPDGKTPAPTRAICERVADVISALVGVDIRSPYRNKRYIIGRTLAALALRRHATVSEIGRVLCRDHSTINNTLATSEQPVKVRMMAELLACTPRIEAIRESADWLRARTLARYSTLDATPQPR